MSASSSDVKELIEDTSSSFRVLLNSLINDSSVSSILIGEIHDFSPTVDAILSNLDLLTHSPRRIIIINEHLNQSDNSTLKKSFKSATKAESDPLKKASFLKEKSIDMYELLYTTFSAGVMVLGAESKKSNPFSTYRSDEITPEVLRKMEAYQKKPERITVTNSPYAPSLARQQKLSTLCI